MITNGLLLTPEVVDRLVPCGLRGVKITLDGDKHTHDRMRPLRGGQGTFDRIIDNIRKVADRTKISIGGNFDESSVDSFPALLDFLKEQEFADKLIKVNFKPVVRDGAAGNEDRDAERHAGANAGWRERQTARRVVHDVDRRRRRIDLRQLLVPGREDGVLARRNAAPGAPDGHAACRAAPATCITRTPTRLDPTARCTAARDLPAKRRCRRGTSTAIRTPGGTATKNGSTHSTPGTSAGIARLSPPAREGA